MSEHPPTIVTPLYYLLARARLLPDFLMDPYYGKKLFEVIIFFWLVGLSLVLFAIIISRHLKKIPNRWQSALEVMVENLANLLDSLIGPGGRQYLPLLGTLFLLILGMNLLGIVPGMMAPTSNWNCTFALALVVIIYVQAVAIKKQGLGGYLKHLAGSPKGVILWLLALIMFPVHIIGELIKPLSLSLRLFCNIYGEDTIILSLANLGLPYVLLTILMMGFAIFASFLQAFIFTALSCIYIMLATTHDESAEHPA